MERALVAELGEAMAAAGEDIVSEGWFVLRFSRFKSLC